MCEPTCEWLGDSSTGRPNTSDCDQVDLYSESTGSEASIERWHRHWRGCGHPLGVEEAHTLPRCPLSMPYASQRAGRSNAVCGPHSSSNCCHEWMSLRCWRPGSVTNSVPTTSPVLVARNGHRCRRPLAAVNDATNMTAFVPKCQCRPSLSLLLWSCYMLHVDFTSIEMTMELDQPPNVVNVLVFCYYFVKHVMAYVTPD